jgi:hypothetical protein
MSDKDAEAAALSKEVGEAFDRVFSAPPDGSFSVEWVLRIRSAGATMIPAVPPWNARLVVDDSHVLPSQRDDLVKSVLRNATEQFRTTLDHAIGSALDEKESEKT